MRNFRDLSYLGLKPGMICRSDVLYKLSFKDKRFLKREHNVRIVIDLRRKEEIKRLKDSHIFGVKHLHIPLASSDVKYIEIKGLKLPDMTAFYSEFVQPCKKEIWRALFALLLKDNTKGILYHCSSGKDRTGVLTAVILTVLGFDKDTVYKDYLLTNESPLYYKEMVQKLDEETRNINNIEDLIFNGVHLYVSTPFYQNPQKICKKSSQYDTIFLSCVKSDFLPRTNFSPKQIGNSYESYIKGFVVGQDIDGNDMYDNWISYYKVGLRKMLDPGMERTLICSLLPPMSSHTNGVISAIFKNNETAVELTGLLSSLTMDFFMKTAASQNMTSGRFSTLPLGISNIFKTSLFVRTLLLNCLTEHYADLWKEM